MTSAHFDGLMALILFLAWLILFPYLVRRR